MTSSGETGVVLGDWGTSRLRLYRLRGNQVRERFDGVGIGALTGSPADALQAALHPWLEKHGHQPIFLCGMAGSRNGVAEVDYVEVPAAPADWARRARAVRLGSLDVTIAPGLKRRAAGSPDVMRGEETQIFGALELEPRLAVGRHLLVLPGTHSKWVQIEDGRITGFTTYVTGELYALLARESTLLRAGSADAPQAEPDGFAAGVARGRAAQGLTATLFEARSRQLIDAHAPGWAQNFLSGVLIGAEIQAALEAAHAAADTSAGRGPPEHAAPLTAVLLIGDPDLTARYRRALELAGVNAAGLDGDACAIAGLLLLACLNHKDCR